MVDAAALKVIVGILCLVLAMVIAAYGRNPEDKDSRDIW
jgi:hypothetical protein